MMRRAFAKKKSCGTYTPKGLYNEPVEKENQDWRTD